MAVFIPTDENDLSKVDASPTKAFFVDIITKDILVDEAILDLVDNCIDGAKRLRPGENPDFSGLQVDIVANGDQFRIGDNCGGIPLEIARKYAFKFGRAANFVPTDRSVGQFGVGMKRALFKMAKNFSVKSIEREHSFEIEVDVEQWASDDINWDFDVKNLVDGPHPADKTGTTLEIKVLDPEVADTLAETTFEVALGRGIRVRHQDAMSRGLSIRLNGVTLLSTSLRLKVGEVTWPMRKEFIDPIDSSTLTTRIFAGVADSDRAKAGWYVFCNGRCILEADQSETTGWNSVIEGGGIRTPKYHNQFARFRGFAFLDSIDASILPWNTTKTGLDPETAAYRLLIRRLITATRPVIDFLNALDGEIDLAESEKVLTAGLERAPSIALSAIQPRDALLFKLPPKKGPPMSWIRYRWLTKEAKVLKAELGATTYPELGEKTFKFAYDNLIEDL